MRRKKAPKTLSSDSSDDEPLSKKAVKAKESKPNDDSSSESDIENYLQPADKIDLNSPFFNPQKDEDKPPSFDTIENGIFAGVQRFSDSESASDQETEAIDAPSTSKLNFRQLHEYTRKIEEAKKHVEVYNARKQAEQKQMDISNLLAVGESKLNEDKDLEAFHSDSDSEKEGWEEVEEHQKEKSIIPREGLQITVEMPGAVRKKKGTDLMAAIKRRINRVKKENQLLIHKVHLLCWIAHGNYVNSVLNSQNVLAVALSLLPSQQCYPADRTDLNYLEQVVKWYRNAVENVEEAVPTDGTLGELLEAQITKKEACNKTMLVYIFIAILRSLGIQCRLILSFQVEPLRPPNSELCSLSTKSNESKPRTSKQHSKSTEVKASNAKNLKNEVPKEIAKATEMKKRPKGTGEIKENGTSKPSKTRSTSKLKVGEEKTRSKNKTKRPEATRQLKIPQLDGANDTATTSKPNLKKLKQKEKSCPVKAHPKRLKPKIKYRDSDSEDDFATRKPLNSVNLKKLKEFVPKKSKGLDVRKDIIDLVKGRIKEQKHVDRSRTVRKRRSTGASDEDSDYVPEAAKKKHRESEDEFAPTVKVKRRVQVRPGSEEEAKKRKRGVDVWAEVFLETEEKWISVDVVKGQVHCVKELYARATPPVSYIVAWNNDNSIKDITSRYCKNFNTVTRKLRIDTRWWGASLKPFSGRKTARDKEEDEELERQQLDKPLPTSIAEYKDHPLYVLKRHLLKFQAIYPPDAPPLGFVRNEPVYSRQCVHTLHSREIWLKHAKTVKPGEKPYKIVKARPRWDKLSNKVITDQELEIYGPWQTEDYVPPTAENGVVPRNAFGNVELFKACMLPKKTVHLKLPGLHKVAKRMNIDCASAIVGFDFHGGWSHPTYDGFVVCEEYADILVAAWELEQDELGKKEREKVDKRVYGNWRKLIRGLLIRERLKKKYEFGDTSAGGSKKKGKGGLKTSPKKRRIESESESE